MLGRNWSSVLRPLCRPQKNSKALRSVLKSDRFFLGVPRRLGKECLPLDLVFFLLPCSVNLFFFSTSLSKLVWSCEGNRWSWISAAEGCESHGWYQLSCYHFLSPPTAVYHHLLGKAKSEGALNVTSLISQPSWVFCCLSSNLMDTKMSSVKLICLCRSQVTLVDILQSKFRKL